MERKKSKFITRIYRIQSEEEARKILEAVKKENWKANHNCSAFVLGERSEITRSSDDGEPSGTAGAPMLEVLVKRDLTNILAVTTRFFGGIKLGGGGLIRAYS
ncbi:MAG: YigZ family protein, partial [Streptococcaceae bacterium]|nr:YigZ family protein [Streptococcaceae bacterium]